MERRSRSRFPENTPVRLTVLDGQDQQHSATMLDFSGTGASVATPIPIAAGTLVRIDCEDTLLLGEVCHCAQNGAQYIAGLKIEHSLGNLRQLLKLRESLEGQETQRERRTASTRATQS